MDKRRIAILGSTGSIGRQTLDVIREHRDLFEVEMLTCKGSWELIINIFWDYFLLMLVIS